ncbi:hypothetical protein GCM10009117_14250 [Gangjinia marincola]|uniref:Uncharacterized protein n=1 Tax=Gangjinia marincola TaxID=578463 RepID=A0ABN1MGJ2_9FLAO
MDGLELLKKDWQQQEKELPHLSAKEIYPLLLKKSSSIVKWIFLISVIEFLFWTGVSIFFEYTDQNESFSSYGLEGWNLFLSVVYYGGILFFMVWFYLNYKRIKATDSAAVLMKNILKTRKTVRYYVWFNILFLSLGLIISSILITFQLPESEQIDITRMVIILTIVLVLVVGILLLFYRLIYGFLVRRLNKNYKELKRIED